MKTYQLLLLLWVVFVALWCVNQVRPRRRPRNRR
jgi:hypothetical protein